MGVEQIFRTVACSVLIAATAVAAPKERVAVIDLGPGDGAIRQKLAAALVAAGLDPVTGDGVEDALAGEAADQDGLAVAAAIATAKQAFGELRCPDATAAVMTAILALSARQAAGLPVPELSRALEYVLLCADRGGAVDVARTAATRLRSLGASEPAVMAKYPTVDALADREVIDVDVSSEVPGAALWVDLEPRGTTPAHLALTAGEHIIAAAAGTRRGAIFGTAVATQHAVTIPMPDQAGRWATVAARVASWHGMLPVPAELAWVLGELHARAALVRHADVVEAWGQAGRAEAPRRLGGVDGSGSVAEADHAAALIADRIASWNDHAPDPDRPLLVESTRDRARRGGIADAPTRWWVYAAIAGAVVAGAVAIYAHDTASDTQRVELHYP